MRQSHVNRSNQPSFHGRQAFHVDIRCFFKIRRLTFQTRPMCRMTLVQDYLTADSISFFSTFPFISERLFLSRIEGNAARRRGDGCELWGNLFIVCPIPQRSEWEERAIPWTRRSIVTNVIKLLFIGNSYVSQIRIWARNSLSPTSLLLFIHWERYELLIFFIKRLKYFFRSR